ncbi:MAG: dethiobiotin synthase [Elusimicrobia bacterium]|nr:dethiobiotin synthase [Elusimicrobiota bacterium]
MSVIFVTGTDTGVGKTMITGLLYQYITKKGYSVITQKWVQTGTKTLLESDVAHHYFHSTDVNFHSYSLPYCFRFPGSPHLAAKLEGRRINIKKIIESFNKLCRKYDFLIVEGTGGIMVPFNGKYLSIDLVKKLNLSVIIVVGNKLGCINHTLLTIDSLKRRNIRIIGLIFNNIFQKQKKTILKDNPDIIEKISGIKVLGIMKKERSKNKLINNFRKIGKKILHG